jgi:fatty acid desaturase
MPALYVRQVVGSENYDYGDDVVTDFAHGYLNYQIEQHVWPDMSMLQYQKAAPKLKAFCDQYGVPYIKDNVFKRLR